MWSKSVEVATNSIEEKLPLHYVVNETMQSLAEQYFLRYVPRGFNCVAHRLSIPTSGDFLKDNFRRITEIRSQLILDEIHRQMDGGLMLWCDIDVLFFLDPCKELHRLAKSYDLLLQREHQVGENANFGVQLIRRNRQTFEFYSRLRDLQQSSENGDIQAVGNRLLRDTNDIAWAFLPLCYSAESNGGCKTNSVLYHANCTVKDSMNRKRTQLEAALNFRQRHFSGFRCKKEGSLKVEYFYGYETRNQSTVRMINLAIERHNIPDFDWIYVNTGDGEMPSDFLRRRAFAYATKSENYENVCPDFVFDHWCQTRLPDYETVREEMTRAGNHPPQTSLLGWRGNITTHPSRRNILKFADKSRFDLEAMTWSRANPGLLTSPEFLSLPDQACRWRYFLDIEGVGWSTRLKLFLFSKRVVFLQDRPFKEWYFPYLKPWEHYVPVNRDLSDLEEKVDFVSKRPELEDKMRLNAFQFAQIHLTRSAALERWAYLLCKCS